MSDLESAQARITQLHNLLSRGPRGDERKFLEAELDRAYQARLEIQCGVPEISIDIPHLPRLNSAANQHWRTKKREHDRYRAQVDVLLKPSDIPESPYTLVRLRCTRHSALQPDYENLCESFKPFIDRLVFHRIIEDDKPIHFVGGRPEYLWAKAPPKQGRITITLWNMNRTDT